MKIQRRRLIVGVALTALLTGCTNPNTPAGHEGYVYEVPRIFGNGGYKGTIDGPGNYGASPWRNLVVNVDVRPNTYSETFSILARDDLNVAFTLNALISIQAQEHMASSPNHTTVYIPVGANGIPIVYAAE